RVVRAGHDPILAIAPGSSDVRVIAGQGCLPLGIDPSRTCLETRERLDPGTLLLLGTDGIWEAENKQGEMFGKERLIEIARKHADSGPQGVVDAVFDSLDRFVGSRGFQDDVTLVVIHVLPTG
ncbi:MAG: PP2C family protein-serine/threonine phosphatase, partial [Desulfovibrionaceae bacterium]